MRKRLIIPVVIIVIAAGAAWWLLGHEAAAPSKPAGGSSSKTSDTATKDTFDKTQYSLTDPSSIWVIVNKQHPLNPISYTPSDLRDPNVTLRVPGLQEMEMRDVAATALEQMFAGASTAGYKLEVSTAYRSYSYQQTLYTGYVGSAGQAAADQESARPGYSEHQTGLAVDIRAQSDQCSLGSLLRHHAGGPMARRQRL
ncbi:MAG: M15 family metallopeptidase [Candidatus Saccharibacteria bacterium]